MSSPVDSVTPASVPATVPALLLTAKQAARALAISDRKLWSLTAGGEIPVVRIGRAVRYTPQALDGFIAARQNGGRP